MPKPKSAKAFFQVEGPVAIAHRGGDGAGFSKRNTMAAFRLAHKLGYRYFETDVLLAKSGELIIAHGAKIGITAKLRGTFSYRTVQSMTYPEIQQKLKIGGEPIPLLSEVLEAFPDAYFIIDPKTDAAVEPLAALLNQTGDYKRTLIGSFYYHRVKRLLELVGEDKAYTKITVGRLSAILRLSAAWFRKLLRRGGRYHPAKVGVYEVPHWFISRAMVVEAHREGRQIIAWTPNTKHAPNWC
jgi:glycerophosphoryl diester phosphodiesterase